MKAGQVFPITTEEILCRCGALLRVNFEVQLVQEHKYRHKCGETTHVNGPGQYRSGKNEKGEWQLVFPFRTCAGQALHKGQFHLHRSW